uniref:Alpha/beta hydrolase n=1 Tax=Eiseniibacteriota bacterium TaxID=2212470 RepID=A0A832I0Q3_UNCEI
MTEPGGFAYRFEPASPDGPPFTLLLLHGTGGDEHDLVPLGRLLAPGAALLSPRGRVLEHGAPRFFRRLAEGVFDEEDVARRAHELADFVAGAAAAHGFDPARVVAAGYSNGANIAAATLLLRPGALAGAVLLRPMVPLVPREAPDLSGVPVLVSAGRLDPYSRDARRLADLLGGFGARVDLRMRDVGHGLDRGDVDLAREWLAGPGATG